MTAPLFFLPAGGLEQAVVGKQVVLDGAEGHHAADVRRIGVGERLDLADGSGLVAETVVVAAQKGALSVAVEALREEPESSPRLGLVQALAKDGRDLQAVESATELGVDLVVPWQAERSIVQWRGERERKAHAKWENTARAAAKQARRARVPKVAELSRRADLAALVAGSALTLVLHEEALDPLPAVDLPDSGDVLVVVGPEGGISAAELDTLTTAGARCVRLGATVLRSSTAGPAALAVLAARARW